MKPLALAAAIVLTLTGCGPINLHPTEVMPTTAPKKLLDCDLIFPAPAPAQDTLTP